MRAAIISLVGIGVFFLTMVAVIVASPAQPPSVRMQAACDQQFPGDADASQRCFIVLSEQYLARQQDVGAKIAKAEQESQ